MRRTITTAALAALLSACASAPPDLSALPSERYGVPVATLIVSNFAQPTEARPMDAVWSSDWVAVGDEATVPPFPDLVHRRLSAQLQASGGEGEMEVTLLRAHILMRAKVSDSVPFLGILSALSERHYRCVIETNFRMGARSERRAFRHETTRSRHWTDLETSDKAALVEACLADIMGQIRDHAVEFAAQ